MKKHKDNCKCCICKQIENKLSLSKETLEKLYLVENKTMKEIGVIFNCSPATVYLNLKKLDIPTRKQGHNTPWNKGLDINDKRVQEYTKKRVKTIKKLYSEGKIKPWNKDLKASEDSRLQYLVETAKKLHEKYDFKGEGNPFYNKKHKEEWKKEQSLRKGGTGVPYEFSSYGSEFTKELKETIRNRDGRKCQVCGCDEKDCYRSLDVHHIDYNKKNCSHNNLISLCSSCHLQTNYNREYWKIILKKDTMIIPKGISFT